MSRLRARHLGPVVFACLACGWASDTAVRPVAAAPPAEPSANGAARPADDPFGKKVAPLLAKFCNGCHGGKDPAAGIAFEAFQSEAHARRDRKTWEAVLKVVASGEMPPKKKPQPTKAERDFFLGWVGESLVKVDCAAPKDPGRVTLRRLNRAEYNNTVRDLCGVDFHPADDFPADESGYGFDNIGDVLSLQPVLLEKYLKAADAVLERALAGAALFKAENQPFGPQPIQVTPRSAKLKNGDARKIAFITEGTASIDKFNFPNDAEYVFRLRAWGTNVGGAYPKVVLQVGGKDLHSFSVVAPEGKPAAYEFRARHSGGEDVRVAYKFLNPAFDKGAREPARKYRTLGVTKIEIDGPYGPRVRADAPARKVLLALPTGESDRVDAARKVLVAFARKAYRRPVRAEEVARLVGLYELAAEQGDSFADAIRLPLKAVLASPHFLYRVESDPADPHAVRDLNDHELAVRLSYFLWSTMPDAHLSRQADAGDLRKSGVLEAEVRRMLRDPKARALSENFGGQWLQLRTLKSLAPDRGYFPDWDEPLRAAMVREAELFFENVVREDRSVLEFLDADYTFANERLARHYGLPNVTGRDFRRVPLPDGRRGGVLTMASTLTVTSNPTRTSPVKRGKWVLENVLGTAPPPPPPDAGELPPTGEIKGTVRQQMEQHRRNPSCATCHARLDPLGIGLENFDAIGAWRTADNKLPIDASGTLPDGASFDGPAKLKKVLLGKAEPFRRCLAEKLMTYAVGRGLEYYDKCALDDATAKLAKGQDLFSALVLAVVQSDPFQKRKGKRSE